MKQICLFIIFLLFFTGISAQKKEEIFIIDTLKLQCIYEQKVIVGNTDDSEDAEEKYITALQIGNKMSKYLSLSDIAVDSIILKHADGKHDRHDLANLLLPYLAKSMKDKLYKNYPVNKIVTQTYLMGPYTYDEPYETPKWVLHNDTKTIKGYSCKKATTTFRGRTYEVWYATQIPISDGPWKFRGLPGLIFSARDSKGEVFFDIQSITKPETMKYIYKNVDSNICIHLRNKKEFTKLKKDYMDSPGAHIAASGLVQSELPATAYKKRPYNPIELSE